MMSSVRAGRRIVCGAALALASTAAAVPLPPVDRVAFAPLPGAVLPVDARLVDEHARTVLLGDFMRARAAIVVPAYYGCSNLCTIVLHAVAEALARSGLRAGKDVDVVAFSISPLDTPEVANSKKASLLGDDQAADGWHFLTGDEASIARISDALGYRYAYVADEKQYAHASGIAVVAPGGSVARVLYGVGFAPEDLRNAVTTASARGSASLHPASAALRDDTASNWLLCFHYDPKVGRYTFAAMSAVRSAALLAFAALAGFALKAWRRERQNARRS